MKLLNAVLCERSFGGIQCDVDVGQPNQPCQYVGVNKREILIQQSTPFPLDSNILASVFRHDPPGRSCLMTQHARFHTDKAPVGLEIALCQIENVANLGVIEVVENTAAHHDVGIGERRIIFATRSGTGHKGSTVSKPPTCEFNVGLRNIYAYIFDIRQHV